MRLTREQRAEALALLKAGERPGDVAARYGVSRQAMSQFRRRAGLAERVARVAPPRPVAVPSKALDWQRLLIEARGAAGYTLVEAAYRVGVEPTTLSRWERGEHLPLIENLRAALNAYGWDLRFEAVPR
jgi:DNA-binding XRE family transcriptional regulator